MNLTNTTILYEEITLRSFDPSDGLEIFSCLNNKLTQHLTWDPPASLEEFSATWKECIGKMIAGSNASFTIRRRSNNEFLGMIGLSGLPHNNSELGLWIKEEEQGKGFGTMATLCVAKWAGAAFNVSHFTYPVAEENTRSRRLVERLGGVTLIEKRHRRSGSKTYNLIVYKLPVSFADSAPIATQ